LAQGKSAAHTTTLAENGRPNVMAAIELGRPVLFRTTTAPVHVANAAGAALGTAAVDDGVALTAWLFRDQLIEAIEHEVDELSDDRHAIDPSQRAERERELAEQMLELERTEEALIEAAADDAIEIARRGNADPRAVLSLANALPAPRT
jgi:hypothetical protein